MRRINYKDMTAGLTFIVLGLGFSYIASSYELGTASEMGPGYFPLWLGLLLAAIGLVVASRALAKSAAEPDSQPRVDLKIVALIIGSVVLFGALAPVLGLVTTVVVTVVVASFASHEFRVLDALAAAAALVGICVVTFVYVLKLPIPVWPAFFGS